MARYEIRWSDEMLAAIDAVRGDVSRAAWIRRAVAMRLALRVDAQGSPTDDPSRLFVSEVSRAEAARELNTITGRARARRQAKP